jgi:hypothetical protein
MSIKTATSVMEDKSGHYLDIRIADFIQRWKPVDDSRDAFEFHVQLNELIRSTYDEAAKPYHKQMMAMLQTMPMVKTQTQTEGEA